MRGISAVTLTAALVATMAIVGGAPAALAAPADSVVPGVTMPATDLTAGRYIVTLADDAVATYDGGVNGYSATAPGAGAKLDAQSGAAEEYAGYLDEQQQEVAASVDATIDYSYTLALNGFAADLSAKQAAKLSADKSVASITKETLHHVTAAEPSTDFLGLSGDDGVWAGIGGPEQAGEGVVIGVLDTGIAPENPSFAGDPLGTEPGAAPYLDGDTITYQKADGNTFTGACVTGEQFEVADCSSKIVGARYYVDGFGADRIGGADIGEYASPRDGDGHGSHTASTAGGNHDVQASVGGLGYGLISGVAPAAKISMYKVCWSGPDPIGTEDDGCASSDLLAGIDQSVADGVDVINYSIGGGAAATTVSPTDQAFLGAASAGIFVAASAGNAGPGASTLDNASPWITTVAASTIPSWEATATFGDGTAHAGASITVDRTPEAPALTGNLVRADLVGVAGHDAADALLCAPDSLDPAQVAGNIVFCERGVYDRTAKSAEVARAGGIGMLLVNRTSSSIDTDLHAVPTVHLDGPYWDETYAYAATPGATVTFTPGNSTDYIPPVPQVAGFSSRGPVEADGSDILKPDITAPGVAILADGANAEGEDPSWQFISGTSMASPHVAGLAALYLGERPNATPAEVKSAMMTTAYNTVDAAGAEVTDPFAQGAGHADPTRFFEPGLLYLNDTDDWWSYIQGIGYDVGAEPIDPSNLNLASIAIGSLVSTETVTRTVTSTQAGVFEAQPIDMPGIEAVVEPATLEFGAAGETQSYTVTFTRTDAPLNAYTTGSLDWVSGDTVVHSPIAVQPVPLVAPPLVEGTGVDGSADVSVTPGATGEIPLNLSGLAAGVHQPNPADPADPNTGSGTAGDEFTYEVVVPDGTQLARFDLDAVDDTTDLDLIVYQLDGPGGAPVAGWQSATGSADERVDLVAPEAGSYQIIASVFGGTTAFDVDTFSVLEGAGEGSLTATPPVIAGEQGVPSDYALSWAGLAPDASYLGLVAYGDTGVSTVVSVESGEAPEPEAPVNTVPPVIEGTPEVGETLTANPGEWDTAELVFGFQWQADGVDIAGATAATYTPVEADAGATLTVVVTAAKDGLPSGTATSAGVVVKHEATVSLSLNKWLAFSWQKVKATVQVESDGDVSGPATVVVDGESYDVVLDANGKGKVTLPPQERGFHRVVAEFAGSDTVAPATSRATLLWVIL
ncbi:S8 family serine peptidase [Glaciibacter superstes]|uniref:S8 family serine peptidase n=1 Tax=Glaciibacter superstes TaxID=501023 RepID=UPI0003B5F090|nr:S8 family serine peptidase [Glaciibacter superstes]